MVRNNRENYLFQTLMPGDYIVVPAISKTGDTGLFCLEIHFDDKILSEGNNNAGSMKFKNSVIERLNNPNLLCKYIDLFIYIINYFIGETISKSKDLNSPDNNELKRDLILFQFKDILSNEVSNEVIIEEEDNKLNKSIKAESEEFMSRQATKSNKDDSGSIKKNK